MTAGVLFPWHKHDGTPVQLAYRICTNGDVEIVCARSAGGFVDLSDDERESATLDIEAERAVAA